MNMLPKALYGDDDWKTALRKTLAEGVDLPRTDRNAALNFYIRHYAERLEHHLRAAPYNWFNFYDFWLPQAIVDAPPAVDATLQHARVS